MSTTDVLQQEAWVRQARQRLRAGTLVSTPLASQRAGWLLSLAEREIARAAAAQQSVVIDPQEQRFAALAKVVTDG